MLQEKMLVYFFDEKINTFRIGVDFKDETGLEYFSLKFISRHHDSDFKIFIFSLCSFSVLLSLLKATVIINKYHEVKRCRWKTDFCFFFWRDDISADCQEKLSSFIFKPVSPIQYLKLMLSHKIWGKQKTSLVTDK